MNTIPPYIKCMGDPHLGRKFTTGVTPERKGDREAIVQKEFLTNLCTLNQEIKYHICLGDLFDKFRVPEEVIDFAYRSYEQASKAHPEVQFYILRGNHDASRDSSLVSSFDLFEQLCHPLPNVTVVGDTPTWVSTSEGGLLLFGWHPHKSSTDLAKEALEANNIADGYIAAGHWDFKDFGAITGEGSDNMVPYDLLSNAKHIISGHYHTPIETTSPEGVPVSFVGSLQPYSHGEDPQEKWYLTRSKDQVLEAIDKDPTVYHLKNLRVILQKGDIFDAEVDCLSLNLTRLKDQNIEIDLSVSADSFDLESIFFTTMKKNNVSHELATKLWENTQEGDE